MDVFQGTLTAPVAQCGYTTDQLGVGTYDATGTNLRLGNNASGVNTWDGRQERHFAVPWKMTLEEMEQYRAGHMAVLFDRGQPHWVYPLDSPTASQCEDLSGRGINGTASNLAAGDGPPVPMIWTPPVQQPVYV